MSADWWMYVGGVMNQIDRAAQHYFDPPDPVEREFEVTEVIKYRVIAVSEEDACNLVANDANRNNKVFEVEDRYAEEVGPEDAL